MSYILYLYILFLSNNLIFFIISLQLYNGSHTKEEDEEEAQKCYSTEAETEAKSICKGVSKCRREEKEKN